MGSYILSHKNKNRISRDVLIFTNFYFVLIWQAKSNLMVCQHLPVGPALVRLALFGLVQTIKAHKRANK